MERAISKHWWRYIPFVIILGVLLVYFYDPFVGSLILLMHWWLVLPLLIWAVIVFLQCWEIGGAHKRAILCFGSLDALVLVLLLIIRIPDSRCDPDEMASHYDKNKVKMEELISFTQSALDEGRDMYLEFEHGKVSLLYASVYGPGNDTEKMKAVGLDEEELKSIKRQLKSLRCISVDTHFPDYCDVGYKRVGFGQYSFRVYLNRMTEDQLHSTLSDGQFIPYDDTMVLMYGGGAVGPQSFSQQEKLDFLKKHSKFEPL